MVTKLFGLALALAILAGAGLSQPALAQGVDAAVAIEAGDGAGVAGQDAIEAFEPASGLTAASVTLAPAQPGEPGVGTVQETHDYFDCLWRYRYHWFPFWLCFNCHVY